MTESKEKIVVFDAFDNAIKANLAKLKLDAYGIPCFITDEHFVNMYPIRNGVFPGVRLHVFESDIDRIREIMKEEEGLPENDYQCPRCSSFNVLYEEGTPDWFDRGIQAAVGLIFGMMRAPERNPKVHRCQDCKTEF